MVVVSDTTAITNLWQIKLLLIIRRLYGELLIPEAVYLELSRWKEQKEVIDQADWIKIVSAKNRELVERLQQQIHAGEAEAIALAVEMEADFLIIDELKGRRVAKQIGIRIIGILGVLALAKEQKHIPAVKPYMDRLKKEAGFRISDRLYQTILEQAGER